MSEAAAALAQRAMQLFNRDFSEEGISEERVPDDTRVLYVEEPVIVPIRAALEGIEYSGPTALEDFAAASRESWTWLRIDIEAMRELDDERVLEGGRIAAVRTFTSEREARAAARP